MLIKGSKEYSAAQALANKLVRIADTDRIYCNSLWNIYDNELGLFIEKIMKLSGFAAEIAATVEKSMRNPYRSGAVARISSKQAWVIACAAIENGIEY